MTGPQTLWWRQARSDFDLYVKLRRDGVRECHLLHYLQMATEKLSKAYLWRSGHPPETVHTGFEKFVKALLSRRNSLTQIASALGFRDSIKLEQWAKNALSLVRALQNIVSKQPFDGPNPEYPWPHHAPTACPADHSFDLWRELTNTSRGRNLLDFVARAVTNFEQIA